MRPTVKSLARLTAAALVAALVILCAATSHAKMVDNGFFIGPSWLNQGDFAFEFMIGNQAANEKRCYATSTLLAPAAQNAIVTLTNSSANVVNVYPEMVLVSTSVAATLQVSNNTAAQAAPTALTILNMTTGGPASLVTAGSKLAGTLPTAAQTFSQVQLPANGTQTYTLGQLGMLQNNGILTLAVGSITGNVTFSIEWCELTL